MPSLRKPDRTSLRWWVLASFVAVALVVPPAGAQEKLPWKSAGHDSNAAGGYESYDANRSYQSAQNADERNGERLYSNRGYGDGSAYNSGPVVRNAPHESTGEQGQTYDSYERAPEDDSSIVDDEYGAPQPGYDYEERRGPPAESYRDGPDVPADNGGGYSQDEIKSAGHQFFGSISKGLASVIEYAFQQSGRPNGYILGEDMGGAFVAGLRYGEGRLYTRDAGTHKVYWQGPSLGYDFGGEGSKTMILVYNLRDPSDIYHRFGGVQGSAYLVGGVSIQFQKHGDVVLAPIRSGVGVRLGANVGYLKYTRRPTWNPF